MADDWWVPKNWPQFWRRAFLFTLPISGSIWLLAVVVGGIATMVLFLFIIFPGWGIIALKQNLWDDPAPSRRGDRGRRAPP